MKKLFLFTLSAGLLTACNSSGEGSETLKDSAIDSLKEVKEAKIDSVDKNMDSLMKKTEATFEKTDSANQAIADSAKKAQ
ncbi:MAG: hypothetical protein EOO11_10395 [Chitinophagaceae bacterium]|nr:MAG: hypothetical protein EOO11_10395 [Chitinophagaceae bacterium]